MHITHRQNSDDSTLLVIVDDEQRAWTYFATSAADDKLIAPDGDIIDVIAAQESGSWTRADAEHVCKFVMLDIASMWDSIEAQLGGDAR